jgi:hypothetical protein
MTVESIFRSRLTAMALTLLALAVGGAGSRVSGDEPIVLRQPTTTSREQIALRQPQTTFVVMTAANEEPVATVAQPATVAAATPTSTPTPVKARVAQGAPFTPHYLCLCPPYCPKPMPCIDCCYKCCPDCYCPKPMPCPNPCYDCVCDDYCPKPMPCRFPQPLCGPRAPCRQSEPCPLYAPFPPRGPCVGP